MRQAKHTPGPWHVVDRNWQISTVFSSSGDEIARCLISPESDDDVDRKFELIKEANSRLIAAAPELLEALIWMVANDETNEGDEPVESLDGESWNDCNKYWIDGLNRARAAIAKATGETS